MTKQTENIENETHNDFGRLLLSCEVITIFSLTCETHRKPCKWQYYQRFWFYQNQVCCSKTFLIHVLQITHPHSI